MHLSFNREMPLQKMFGTQARERAVPTPLHIKKRNCEKMFSRAGLLIRDPEY